MVKLSEPGAEMGWEMDEFETWDGHVVERGGT